MDFVNKILCGSALEKLRELPDQSVDTCVTSPPYWGLRDYGVDGQIGLEETPAEFIENMVNVFREVRRVLKDSGTCWINIGDSYATTGVFGSGGGHAKQERTGKMPNRKRSLFNGSHLKHNCKPKDLVGIPWMLAFALRNDGWYLRQDIIWSKPNPMPESVKDRCTKSHEYIFLLSKSPQYFYDHVAIKTPLAEGSYERSLRGVGENNKYSDGDPGSTANSLSQPRERVAKKATIGGNKHKNLESKGQLEHPFHRTRSESGEEFDSKDKKANKKSVWNVATKGYKEAHFATYPEKLIVDCIKAGCPHEVCSKCGAAKVRIYKTELVPTKKAAKTFVIDKRDIEADKQDQGSNRQKDGHKSGHVNKDTTIGFDPTCDCGVEFIPGIVLDPFMGAGTTALVARKLDRNYVGIDLNIKYIKIAENRVIKEIGLFN